MPIHNFKKIAERAKTKFIENKKISQSSKNLVADFMKVYNTKKGLPVSESTKQKFYEKITPFLERINNLKEEIEDRDLINEISAAIRKESSSVTQYAMITAVTKRFVRWVADGEPKGFRDWKNVSETETRRDLNEDDMLTLDDAKKLCDVTTSIQMKAIIMTQLDAGMRPSEFIDLKWGDVEVKKDIVIFTIKDGKTGARIVPCLRCVPFFLRWYQSHPTKKDPDPLWVNENIEKGSSGNKEGKTYISGIVPYSYDSLRHRMMDLAKKAGIKKPIDFYNFRHSSCTLDKDENLPLELASKRHGHSVKYFTEVYGREKKDKIAERYRKHYNPSEEKKKKEEVPKNIICERCDCVNEPKTEFCFKCGSPLSLAAAMKNEEQMEQLTKKFEELKGIRELLEKWAAMNPDFKKFVAKEQKK